MDFVHCGVIVYRQQFVAGKGALSGANASQAFIPCAVCQEKADKICVECGDYYCSRTWLGNPGCFAQFHSKGNRATHTTESLSKPTTAGSVGTDGRGGASRQSLRGITSGLGDVSKPSSAAANNSRRSPYKKSKV